MSDIILFAHPTLGVLGTLAAVWVFVEALNASEANRRRTQWAAIAVAACMVLAWVLGGYWYVNYYYAEKAIILKGPWPFAHDVFMETKEHLFFIPLILALYLPVAASRSLARNRGLRVVVLATAGFIVLNALAIEGAGAVVNHGAKIAVMPSATRGSE